MRVQVFIIVIFVMLSSGCAAIKAWDRDLLADKHMQLVPSPMDKLVNSQVYFSKEASSGGQGLGGGGCGCN